MGIVTSKGRTGLRLLVAVWTPCMENLPKNEIMQQQAKPSDRNSLYLDALFELKDLVFLKQVFSSLEMSGKKADRYLSVV